MSGACYSLAQQKRPDEMPRELGEHEQGYQWLSVAQVPWVPRTVTLGQSVL